MESAECLINKLIVDAGQKRLKPYFDADLLYCDCVAEKTRGIVPRIHSSFVSLSVVSSMYEIVN